MDIDSAAQTTVVLAFLGGMFQYVVIKPLTARIEELKDAIVVMKEESKERTRVLNEMEKRMILYEAKVDALHRRLDDMERRQHDGQ